MYSAEQGHLSSSYRIPKRALKAPIFYYKVGLVSRRAWACSFLRGCHKNSEILLMQSMLIEATPQSPAQYRHHQHHPHHNRHISQKQLAMTMMTTTSPSPGACLPGRPGRCSSSNMNTATDFRTANNTATKPEAETSPATQSPSPGLSTPKLRESLEPEAFNPKL